MVSGIVFVLRNGLRWRDAPPAYGPHKTLYDRFVRWSRMGVFDRIFAALAAEAGTPDRLIVDATHLKVATTSLDGVAPFEAFTPLMKVFKKVTIEPVEVR